VCLPVHDPELPDAVGDELARALRVGERDDVADADVRRADPAVDDDVADAERRLHRPRHDGERAAAEDRRCHDDGEGADHRAQSD
jgi:hypothetical protein